ncbi:Crp/Fnr family transcriptional regulator [Virgibacillus senegalensis]|uniref:Crp/Fnr family transcriptional regulator n=1 Tax=Virgibacillus senegalensis TaxID=1499679 RepID=UPI000B06C8F8|nr:Crp/Fnr family transcriptional regulator [Virgibacillus senegalensis]
MGAMIKREQPSGNTWQFSPESFSKIKGIMYEHVFTAGSTLFWEGDEAEKLYYLEKGSIRLTKTADDGKDLCLYYFRDGDLFGELQYPGQQGKMSYTAEVLQDARVGVIQQRDLEILLWQHGDLAIEFSRWLGYMQRLTQVKLRDLMFHGKNGALASTLIRAANTYGVLDGGTIHFTEKFTHSELASLIGATRETVNRMLNQLKKQQVIDTEQGRIVIGDLPALKSICHCEECPLEICRL